MKKTILTKWEKVFDSGFNDKHNICLWSMKSYKNYLYVGTLNLTNGCKVYRSKSGDKGSWEKVSESGFGIKNRCIGIRTMFVYKDLLWTITHSIMYGSQVWVTNGEYDENSRLLKWKKANINGFGHGKKIPASRGIEIYKNKLYVGTECRDRLPPIYRYDGPTDFDKIRPEEWTCINEDWNDKSLNIPKISLVGDLLNFKSSDNDEYLYIPIYSDDIAYLFGKFERNPNIKTILEIIKFFLKMRCNILRYNGKKWEIVSKPGFGRKNLMAMSSLVFKKSIYFGTTKTVGGEIWKSKDGKNWTRIMKRGFSFPFNISVWKIHPFKNKLVIGTQNQWFGCQIWASKNENPLNNKDFIQIAKTGMTKRLQINPLKIKQDGIKSMETFNEKLYVGTSSYMNILSRRNINGPGCEIWRIDNI